MGKDLESRTVEIPKDEADKTLLLNLKMESRLGKFFAAVGGIGIVTLYGATALENMHNYRVDKLIEKINEMEATYGYDLTKLTESIHHVNYWVAKGVGGILIPGLLVTSLLGWWTYKRVKDYIKDPIDYLKERYSIYSGREIKFTDVDQSKNFEQYSNS